MDVSAHHVGTPLVGSGTVGGTGARVALPLAKVAVEKPLSEQVIVVQI